MVFHASPPPSGGNTEVLEGGGDDDAQWRRRWAGSRIWVAALIVALGGALVGVVATRAWDSAHPSKAAPPGWGVQVSLGAYVGGLNGVDKGVATVVVSSVMLNTGLEPVTLVAIKIVGPGAGFVANPAGGPNTGLPVLLPPGQFVDVRFGMSSSCSVAVRPVPTVMLVTVDRSGRRHEVIPKIPDLDRLWGASLAPGVCPKTQ